MTARILDIEAAADTASPERPARKYTFTLVPDGDGVKPVLLSVEDVEWDGERWRRIAPFPPTL